MSRRLTLLGRSGSLLLLVLLANIACWSIAGLTFSATDGLTNLALLAWTLGLRHGLDADHISAIDNATRHLVSLGQLPVTCGLWFSLGHSTIVIVVNVAIAVSVDLYDKLEAVGDIGGIVGTAVSSIFLFLIAVINIFFLVKAIRARQRARLDRQRDEGEEVDGLPAGGGMLVRVVGPVLKTVDMPWKLYPVGLLFGLGFDTASSIALLAISALAQRGPDGETINRARIIVLPFLFTVGMTLVDSLDSVLMLYAYASPSRSTSEGKISLFQPQKHETKTGEESEYRPLLTDAEDTEAYLQHPSARSTDLPDEVINNKLNVMSSLSITLTALSIVVALSISVIEVMGLIGENCVSCREAADAEGGGGFAGAWWRAWAKANDLSGLIGAGIVGTFALILVVYHGGQWLRRRALQDT